MKKTVFILAMTFAMALSVVAECSDSDKKALETFDRAWGDAGEHGDRAALMNIYADDYVGFPGMQNKMQTIETTMKGFEANKANPSGAAKITHDAYTISCTSNSATIIHRNTIWEPVGTGGRPETLWTRSVHFLERRGGKWYVVSDARHAMDDYMTLAYLEQDWNDADISRNKAWFEQNYASDYSSVATKDGALSDKAQDIADTMKGPGSDDWNELSELNIRIDRNTAVVTGVNHVKGKDDKGAAFDHRFRFTDTWIKRDGRWQAWATQGTRIP
jgi:ketosteroid isomerase-like protein